MTSGIMITMLGIEAILVLENYNLFDDKALIPLVMFIIVLCIVVHLGTLYLGKLLKI